MAKILFNTIVLFIFHYAFSQDVVKSQSGASKDPVSVLLKELGYIILDVDQAYSEYTAPKVEFEDGVKERKYGRPRSEYFNQIRENYKQIQRIGQTGFNDLTLSSNLFGVKIKNRKQAAVVDVSIPSLPLNLQVRSKIPIAKEPNSQGSDIAEKVPESSFSSKMKVGDSEIKIDSAFTLPDTLSSIVQTGRVQEPTSEVSDTAEGRIPKAPKSRLASKIKVGNAEIKLDSAFALPDTPSETKLTRRVQETGSEGVYSAEFTRTTPESRLATKIKVGDTRRNTDLELVFQDTPSDAELDALDAGHLIILGDLGEGEKRTPLVGRADEELVSLFNKTYYEFLLSDKWADDFQPSDIYISGRGRIFGDLLYSESTFDKLTKDVIQNSKWVLDSDLSPSKVLKRLEDIAKSVFSRRRLETKVLPEANNFESDYDIDENVKENGFPWNMAAVERRSDSVEPEIHGVSDDGSNSVEVETQPSNGDQMESKHPNETILLAFSSNGVPVKLRMGPEINRPYRFLHGILSSAGVTLNVQRKQNDGADLTEKKIEHFTSSLNVDLSNDKQLYAFLRTLREFKASRAEE